MFIVLPSYLVSSGNTLHTCDFESRLCLNNENTDTANFFRLQASVLYSTWWLYMQYAFVDKTGLKPHRYTGKESFLKNIKEIKLFVSKKFL